MLGYRVRALDSPAVGQVLVGDMPLSPRPDICFFVLCRNASPTCLRIDCLERNSTVAFSSRYFDNIHPTVTYSKC